MTKYGSFNEKNEFVIHNPYTPEAWLQYLIRPEQKSTSTFCSGVTHAGGGFDIQGTHENTLSDTKIHLQEEDSLVRCIYIKDKKTNEIWSTSWQPTRKEEQKFTTTFSFGKILFESSYKGIDTKVSMFVPKIFDGWVQNVSITNTTNEEKELELYPFVPMHIGDALQRLMAGDNDAFFGGVKYDADLKGLVFRRHHGIEVNDDPEKINGMLGTTVLFHSSLNKENQAYESDLLHFYGDRFHNHTNPKTILESKLSNRDIPHLRRPCGVFQHIVSLKPGETIDFALSLISDKTSDYYLNNKTELKAHLEAISTKEKREALLADIEEWWRKRLESLQIKSPNKDVNTSFQWLQYQCEIVLILNRMKSRFHTGYEYGWGFRDILQDILYLLPYRPELMKELLLHISTQIFTTGISYHNFFISQPGNKSIEASDDPLWFVQAVIQYCYETGDYDFLNEVSYYAEKREDNTEAKGTILEHCFVSLDRVITDRSERNLPYLKDCDWNDDLNEKRVNDEPSKNMESIMVAQQLVGALHEFQKLMKNKLPQNAEIEKKLSDYAKAENETREALLKYAVDKKGYFKRALSVKDASEDLGSSENLEAKIFLEPQIFAITNETVDLEKGKELLAHVEKELDSPWGAMLCYPYFNGLAYRDELPQRTWNIEKEPPGLKENGSIFMHLNAWLVEAYCKTGQGNKALAMYEKTLPMNLSKYQDSYSCEPYVYPEYVRGKGAQEEGRGGHTWLTGTAPTMHKTIIESIFGVKPVLEGLRIKPCVSSEWKAFSIKRKYQNAVYSIDFENPEGVETGIARVTLDGKEIQSEKDSVILPSFGDNAEHYVIISMGAN